MKVKNNGTPKKHKRPDHWSIMLFNIIFESVFVTVLNVCKIPTLSNTRKLSGRSALFLKGKKVYNQRNDRV